MSVHESEVETSMTASGRARRRFLKHTALAAASASTAAMLPAVTLTATQASVKAPLGSCPDLKAPMKDVDGKVAFITGGDSGVGLGIARAFTDAGMKVVISYRTKSHLDEAMKYLESAKNRVHAISVDVTDRPGMEKAAAETVQVFGKVHVLVNNAGVALNGAAPLSRATYDDWDWMMGVNLTGVFNGVHSFLPRIQAHGEGGQIVTTSSMRGLYAVDDAGCYCTSKYAVVGMMESLRAEFVNTNIGASVFLPGLVTSNVWDSNRNRSRDLANTGTKTDPKTIAAERNVVNDPKLAMSALEAGRLMLRGMRNNDLYILTHPEFAQIMRDRNEALMASIPMDLHPTEERMAYGRALAQNSIYITERDHERCTRAAHAKKDS
ncbi:MAG: SDR family NAD(P)-dependent oxidoreductase [Steroidobacteraceae bacterium]